MNAYLLLSRTDDATDAALKDIARFSVRTTGCFAAYGALTVDSLEELRELTERIAAIAPGDVQVRLATHTKNEALSSSGSFIPAECYDPVTGQIDWGCVGRAYPSAGLKASYFAVAELRVDGRDDVHEKLSVTGGITGMVRLIDPNRLLIEVGARDPELLLAALDGISSVPGVTWMRTGVATRPLDVERAEAG